MDNLKKYLKKETHAYEVAERNEISNLTQARRYLWINVAIYVAITVIEYILSVIGHSQALQADAFNNLSGVISTGLLIIGSLIATSNDDDLMGEPIAAKHGRVNEGAVRMSRFRLETIFTLLTSFVIVLIAGQIVFKGIRSLFAVHEVIVPNMYSSIGAAMATMLMLVVYAINRIYGKRLNNASLVAASRDSLGDVVTSLGTLVGLIVATYFSIPWLDGALSIVLGLFILWSGFKVFQEAALNLADYVDPELEKQMRDAIKKVSADIHVMTVKGRRNGNVLIVNAVIAVPPKMDALHIYEITEQIEHMLHDKFNVFDTDVSVVPNPHKKH